jgi:hypothetical protein
MRDTVPAIAPFSKPLLLFPGMVAATLQKAARNQTKAFRFPASGKRKFSRELQKTPRFKPSASERGSHGRYRQQFDECNLNPSVTFAPSSLALAQRIC